MKHTLNVKIVLFTIIVIMILIASAVIYVLDLANFEGSDALFLPIIVGMVLTIIRIFQNLGEKNKIIGQMREEREVNMDQEKMTFTTCPEYWTKSTENDQVICRNEFTNKNAETHYIGGVLSKVGSPSESLKTEDAASNIGFEFDVEENEGEHSFNNMTDTYIPSMRSNLTLPTTKNRVVENFEDSDGHDTTPHKHHRTYVDFAHTDKPVAWVDGTEREHDTRSYRDSKHLVIYNEEVFHDHTTNNVYDYAGNLIWGKANGSAGGSNIKEETKPSFSNDENWISPHQTGDLLLAEINLTELNKASNKCQLAKNLPWLEAKNKCANVNVKFDM
jgi:hypothetical protein